MGLKKLLYDNPYTNSGREDLPRNMALLQRFQLKSEITVTGKPMIEALFSMTPYFWRTSLKDRQKLTQADTLTTELDFDIFLFRKENRG